MPTTSVDRIRRVRVPVVLGSIALVSLLLAGCAEDEQGASATTTVQVASTTVDGDAATTAPSAPSASSTTASGGPVTTDPDPGSTPTTSRASAATTTTALLPASSGLPPELSKNSKGVDIKLDETALLACAQDQIAWVALEGGSTDDVSAALGIAAQRAASSAVPEVKASAPTLQAAAESASPKPEVDRFLALCVANGFEA